MSHDQSRRSFLRRVALTGAAGVAGGLAAACRARGLDPAQGRVQLASGTKAVSGPWVPLPSSPSPAPGAPLTPTTASVIPACFVGHGSPTTVLDPERGGLWTKWAAAMPRPRAIVVVSAHWEESPLMVGSTERRPLIYDYYGFDDEMYQVKYDAPGAPTLGDQVEKMLTGVTPVSRDAERWLDHGAFVPLRWMYPKADVPVLPISLPTDDPKRLLAIGRALAPLRKEGVLVLGSGNVTHNLRRTGSDLDRTPAWASDFDAWCAQAVAHGDLDALLDYKRKAPAPQMAHPTTDHWIPMYVVLGAGDGGAASFPVTGWEGSSISRRCVQIA
jgi:4,5-DOPA dioxygenase extradiol